jgi:hypothetical protein
LIFLFLHTHATSYSFYSPVIVHCKGERRKPDGKPYPLPYGLGNPYRNLKFENSQDYAPVTSTKLYVHEFGFKLLLDRYLRKAESLIG